MRSTFSRSVTAVKPKALSLQTTGSCKLGQSVNHEKFGEGVILQMEGSGAQKRVQINFLILY
jgi:DNA helicase-2/ATP-dependent DNA helicase PcrA